MRCSSLNQRLSALIITSLLSACGSQAPAARDASVVITSASTEAPVVVELFQSQGCSSCPPANANINAIAMRPEVLALSYGVTYWDKLGWEDSFAKEEYTARQWAYARSAGRTIVATPQVVINGGRTIIGSNAAELNNELIAAGSPKGGPSLIVSDAKVIVAGSGGPDAHIWLVRYDPKERAVAIQAGENQGRTLPHRNVVIELVKLGEWTGTAVSLPIPPQSETGLKSAILVQQGPGGLIIAARRI